MSFLIKLLLSSLLLFGAFALIVDFPNYPWKVTYPEHQWDRNVLKAEEFLLNNAHCKNIILGSSMASKIDASILGSDWCNLAFDGQSAYDGLDLLLLSELEPQIVLIEANVLERGANTFFLEKLRNPINSYLMQHFAIFKTKNKPTQYIRDPVKYQLISPLLRYWPEHQSGHSEKPVLKEQILISQRKYQSRALSKEEEERITNLFADLVALNDSKVLFFFMPSHESLCDLNWELELKRMLAEKIGKENIIDAPNCTEYKTSDAVHLDRESALRFSGFLQSNLKTKSLSL